MAPHAGQASPVLHCGSQTLKIRVGRCNGYPYKVCFNQVWVVFSGDDGVFGVVLLVSVWFQLSTK